MDSTLKAYIAHAKPTTVLDVGVGAGKVGALVKAACPTATVHGIEVHKPYFTEFAEAYKRYTSVANADYRTWMATHVDWKHDMVIFSDVLEHFNWSEVMDALHFTAYRSKWIACVWPERCAQGSSHGNVLEAHRCVISLADLARFNVIRYAKSDSNGYWKHAALIRGWV